jgi:hypothetical protein
MISYRTGSRTIPLQLYMYRAVDTSSTFYRYDCS